MSDAWQPHPSDGGPAPSNDQAWTNGGARSPSPRGGAANGDRERERERERGGDRPSDRRSRSPERRDSGAPNGDSDRGRPEGGTNPGNNLHVSGLAHRVDNRELESVFSKFGKVARAAIMYDPHTRESRGFGFVTMETNEAADAAVAALHGSDLMGKNLVIEKARRGRARTPTPGRYFGPPKRSEYPAERPYDPRPYDSRYARRDERPARGYDDRRYRDDRRYEDRRYEERDRRYDDRRVDDRRVDDRRYDDRRYEDRRYDDRRHEERRY